MESKELLEQLEKELTELRGVYLTKLDTLTNLYTIMLGMVKHDNIDSATLMEIKSLVQGTKYQDLDAILYCFIRQADEGIRRISLGVAPKSQPMPKVKTTTQPNLTGLTKEQIKEMIKNLGG